jgi:hypothetical protein
MTFGLTSPKKITNLFGNWLKGIPKNNLVQIRVGVCVVIWTLWNTRNDDILNNPKIQTFVGYPYGYLLDSYVVLSPTRGVAGGNGFCMQPFRDGSSGFI